MSKFSKVLQHQAAKIWWLERLNSFNQNY